MDWQTMLQDASIIASVSTAIFFVIDFVKKLYYKLPWGWIQKTPGEVWFALSVLFGVAVAVLVYWDNFFGTGATVSGGISATVYGLVSGAGSKFINAIASSAGARLKTSKEEALAKADTITNGKTDTVLGSAAEAPAVPPEPVTEAATPDASLEKRIEETKKRIEQKHEESIIMIPKETDIPLVQLVQRMKTEADYVIIDGKVYEITKEKTNGK